MRRPSFCNQMEWKIEQKAEWSHMIVHGHVVWELLLCRLLCLNCFLDNLRLCCSNTIRMRHKKSIIHEITKELTKGHFDFGIETAAVHVYENNSDILIASLAVTKSWISAPVMKKSWQIVAQRVPKEEERNGSYHLVKALSSLACWPSPPPPSSATSTGWTWMNLSPSLDLTREIEKESDEIGDESARAREENQGKVYREDDGDLSRKRAGFEMRFDFACWIKFWEFMGEGREF